MNKWDTPKDILRRHIRAMAKYSTAVGSAKVVASLAERMLDYLDDDAVVEIFPDIMAQYDEHYKALEEIDGRDN